MLKKGDTLLVLSVLLIVLAGFAAVRHYSAGDSGKDRMLVVKQDGRVIKTVNLDTVDKPERITVQGHYKDVILLDKGRARFEDADCPDLVCVGTGWLNKSGDTAVCLPNRTVATIEGADSKVDAVSY